jgi:uncharacterized metal-binding protein YceD (DUF177 family)
VIPFVGLKLGNHKFTYEITDTFFESFEYSLIHAGKLEVTLNLEKKETMMIGNFTLIGSVSHDCDRCTDSLDVVLNNEYKLIYKFDTEPSNDETLVVIFPEEFELDIAEKILELITVSIPKRVVHEEGDCNEEMMKLYNSYTLNAESGNEFETEEENYDQRWSALKKLKKDK